MFNYTLTCIEPTNSSTIMKPKVLFSLVILAFIFHSCNSEKKEIKGIWTDQKMSESFTYYRFNKDGTYIGLVFEEVDRVFRHGSIGYYKYIGLREFNLYQVDIDLSPIIGKPQTDAAVGIYFLESLDSLVELDLDSTKPSFLAQIQGDGEYLHITQNGDVIIELRRKDIKFFDKR